MEDDSNNLTPAKKLQRNLSSNFHAKLTSSFPVQGDFLCKAINLLE